MSKPGSGGIASKQNEDIERRERVKQLTHQIADLSKDPYFMRNNIGIYECRLCLTLHNNEGNYLAHTQGKRHRSNLARRAHKGRERDHSMSSSSYIHSNRPKPRKTPKIGNPGYKVTKRIDSATGQKSLIFEINYPEVGENIQPRHRFMSVFEQRVDALPKNPADRKFQYLLFAAEPYETVCFKIPNWNFDVPVPQSNISSSSFDEIKSFTHWDKKSQTYTMKLTFKHDKDGKEIQITSGDPDSNPK